MGPLGAAVTGGTATAGHMPPLDLMLLSWCDHHHLANTPPAGRNPSATTAALAGKAAGATPRQGPACRAVGARPHPAALLQIDGADCKQLGCCGLFTYGA